MWSPENVVEEMLYLNEHFGIRNIKIADEMFVLNKQHVLGICKEIERHQLSGRLNIWAYARVDTVTFDLLGPMAAAGFRWLALGIESASEHVRDGAKKGGFGQEDILKTVSLIQSYGINVIGNYIFGLPDDTDDTMHQTLALAKEARCEFANFYTAMAYPGSALYAQASEKGIALPDSWSGYSQHSYDCQPLPTDELTSAEVLAFRDYAFQNYFADASYLNLIERRFGQNVVEHIGKMRSKPLPRKLLGGMNNLATRRLEDHGNLK